MPLDKDEARKFWMQRRKFFDLHKPELKRLRKMWKDYESNGRDEFEFLKIQESVDQLMRQSVIDKISIDAAISALDLIELDILREELAK